MPKRESSNASTADDRPLLPTWEDQPLQRPSHKKKNHNPPFPDDLPADDLLLSSQHFQAPSKQVQPPSERLTSGSKCKDLSKDQDRQARPTSRNRSRTSRNRSKDSRSLPFAEQDTADNYSHTESRPQIAVPHSTVNSSAQPPAEDWAMPQSSLTTPASLLKDQPCSSHEQSTQVSSTKQANNSTIGHELKDILKSESPHRKASVYNASPIHISLPPPQPYSLSVSEDALIQQEHEADDFDYHLQCGICFSLDINCVQSGCGRNHIFCYDCLSVWLDRQLTCPMCLEVIDRSSVAAPEDRIRRLILEKLVRCIYCPDDFVGPLRSIPKHWETSCVCPKSRCDFFRMGCPYECSPGLLARHHFESRRYHVHLLMERLEASEVARELADHSEWSGGCEMSHRPSTVQATMSSFVSQPRMTGLGPVGAAITSLPRAPKVLSLDIRQWASFLAQNGTGKLTLADLPQLQIRHVEKTVSLSTIFMQSKIGSFIACASGPICNVRPTSSSHRMSMTLAVFPTVTCTIPDTTPSKPRKMLFLCSSNSFCAPKSKVPSIVPTMNITCPVMPQVIHIKVDMDDEDDTDANLKISSKTSLDLPVAPVHFSHITSFWKEDNLFIFGTYASFLYLMRSTLTTCQDSWMVLPIANRNSDITAITYFHDSVYVILRPAVANSVWPAFSGPMLLERDKSVAAAESVVVSLDSYISYLLSASTRSREATWKLLFALATDQEMEDAASESVENPVVRSKKANDDVIYRLALREMPVSCGEQMSGRGFSVVESPYLPLVFLDLVTINLDNREDLILIQMDPLWKMSAGYGSMFSGVTCWRAYLSSFSVSIFDGHLCRFQLVTESWWKWRYLRHYRSQITIVPPEPMNSVEKPSCSSVMTEALGRVASKICSIEPEELLLKSRLLDISSSEKATEFLLSQLILLDL